LLKVVGRLPAYLLNRWRRKAVDLKRKERRLPNLEDIVNFVEDAAEVANDPLYGNIRQSDKADSKETRPKRNQASYSTQGRADEASNNTGTSSNFKCRVCDGPHPVYHCEKFKGLNPSGRFEASHKNGLCFNCLRTGHSSKLCKSAGRCAINGCGMKHHSLLHRDKLVKEGPQKRDIDTKTDKVSIQNGFVDTQVDCLATGASHSHKRIALPIVAVNVKAPRGGKVVTTFALLDSGSTNSFCSASLLDELGIEGTTESIALTTLERSQSLSKVKVASLQVSDLYNNHVVKLPVVYARENLPINSDNIATCDDLSCWPHLQGIDLPAADTDQVLLLIGQDAPEVLVPREVLRGGRNEPYATKTLLGWTLNGPMKQNRQINSVASNFITAYQPNDELLHEQVERFWKLESSGIVDDTQCMSVNDKRVLQTWRETADFKDGHYEFGIPFKQQDPNLPDNRKMAESRLKSLGRKLDKNHELKVKYAEGICDLLHKGYAIKVPEQEIARSDGKVWYLPHRPVIKSAQERRK
jgi:hypothetical protein